MDDDVINSDTILSKQINLQEETVLLASPPGPDVNEMDAFDEDLYGDLTVDINQELTYEELKQLYEDSQVRVKELTKENQLLKEQNLVLKKNISSLYLTAREEIQRKDSRLNFYQDREMRKRVVYSKNQEEKEKTENAERC